MISSTYLEQQIAEAEAALAEIELQSLECSDKSKHSPSENEVDSNMSVGARLARLNQAAHDMELAQAITSFAKHFAVSTPSVDDFYDVREEARRCESLGKLLLECFDESLSSKSKLFQSLLTEEYLPLYAFLHYEMVSNFRGSLKQNKYPSPEGCEDLGRQAKEGSLGSSFYAISSYAEWINRLEFMHRRLASKLPQGSVAAPGPDAVIVECLRPFVERVNFHFVERDEGRVTSSRIDRLPEWLFTYLRENIIENGPWSLIENLSISFSSGDDTTRHYGDHLPVDFLNELIRLVQFVLGERNFFRHPKVVGPDSNPTLLCNAIEQLLRFDDYLLKLVCVSDFQKRSKSRLLSLMDIFVTGDDELLEWWMHREKESVFSTLFYEKVTKELVNRVSPRAELFCALIRSIKAKANVFSFSGPYLSNVAAPLCMQFLDAVHESSADLRNVLVERKIPSTQKVQDNTTEWIEIVNGTHMAALILIPNASHSGTDTELEEEQQSLSGGQDLIRFGKSLHNLESVLIQEFCKAFVETLLMERARFAAYLMRLSSLLASDDPETMEAAHGSTELRETQRLLSTFMRVCDDTSALDISPDEEGDEARELAMFAPRLMRNGVLSLLAKKLLEVVLDHHGVTPDLLQPGGTAFLNHAMSLFGASVTLPAPALRLLDVTRLVGMDSSQLAQIGDALCGLADCPPPLSLDHFAGDDRLYQEAVDMVRAKGLAWIELDDVVSVLNRRRDLVRI